MADHKKAHEELKRVYNIPLRKAFLNVQRYKRAKKAINAIKAFLVKNMKSEDVRLGQNINLKVWEHGIKNPPHHIQVNATKNKDGVVNAELVGFEYSEKKPEQMSRKDRKAVESKAEEKKEAANEEKAVKKGKKALQKELNSQKQ